MLTGSKVCLGPLVKSDAPLVFNWLNNVDTARASGSYSPTDQIKFDQWFAGLGGDPARVFFAIRRVGDLGLLGYLQLVNIQPVARFAELGLMIGEASERGKGYGQEAIGLAVDFCWRDLNLQRVSMFVVGDNPAAIRAYAKVGFKLEGTMRRGAYRDGRHQDMTVMGLLREDAEPARWA